MIAINNISHLKILPDYHKRKEAINDFNANNRWIKRGIAIVPMKFQIDYYGSLHALVSIYHRDGSVAVTVGGIEMGQGLNTKVAAIVAHILGIPMDKVSIKPSNLLTSPNAIFTGGSIGSEVSCYASFQHNKCAHWIMKLFCFSGCEESLRNIVGAFKADQG